MVLPKSLDDMLAIYYETWIESYGNLARKKYFETGKGLISLEA